VSTRLQVFSTCVTKCSYYHVLGASLFDLCLHARKCFHLRNQKSSPHVWRKCFPLRTKLITSLPPVSLRPYHHNLSRCSINETYTYDDCALALSLFFSNVPLALSQTDSSGIRRPAMENDDSEDSAPQSALLEKKGKKGISRSAIWAGCRR